MEALMDIGRFFVNPLLYIALLAAILLGYFRVKKERKLFRTRIVWGWREFGHLLKDGILYALIFSVLFSAIGLTVSLEWLVALSLVSALIVISGIYYLASFAYLALGAIGLGWLLANYGWTIPFGLFDFGGYAAAWNWLLPVALITGAMVFLEGRLVARRGEEASSPRLEKTSRGLTAVFYKAKRLWLIPLLLVVPGDLLDAYLPYWPQFTIGSSSFSFILFPAVIGFQSKARKSLPVHLYPKLGNQIWVLGLAIIVLALFAYLWEPMALIALVAGAAGRAGISLFSLLNENKGNHAVAPQATGVMIVDVLADSPAEKMGLVRGEIIRKVNGLTVTNETELYEAIQINAAHCRLEVLDHNKEIRLRQHVIFRHDHYRLGLIVV
ncbi:PDZ domain-containing protein [Planococcus halotolerans]|uniref:PDZ domain-containing protein n=1 Tax=Planococcus halotolerans TaxID=2233542 RepID=A0A365L3V9_9BACL|nr:PDZ domain-containing protein [Planococcus halotolerans]RAZ79709.1 PDZ domain-containing protein [Planococcus halotolerans]